jgi:hypothetical protein
MRPTSLKSDKNDNSINKKSMNNKTYVIYSEDLKGFLSNDGTSLTNDINKAIHYASIGQAMTAAYKATERLRGIFKFHEISIPECQR